jgi:hypothetical protein
MNTEQPTTPVMTLEETIAYLQREVVLCDENIEACADNDFEEEENLLCLRKSVYQAAINHLEAGRRDTERLDVAQKLGVEVQYCGGRFIVSAPGGRRFMTSCLRSGLDGYLSNPEQEGQQG